MAGVVTLTSGRLNKAASWRSVETLTASTSTTPQAISVETDVTILGGSTVTAGAVRNLYTLAAGEQGQEKLIMNSTSTGHASVIFAKPSGRQLIPALGEFQANGSTASAFGNAWTSGTGQFVLSADGDFLLLRFIGSDWNVVAIAGATLATTT